MVDWNATATQAAVTSGLSPDLNPLAESRLYAMTAIAVHDALNGMDLRYRPYLHQDLHASRWASPTAAVAAAARNVLVPGLRELAPSLPDQQAVPKPSPASKPPMSRHSGQFRPDRRRPAEFHRRKAAAAIFGCILRQVEHGAAGRPR